MLSRPVSRAAYSTTTPLHPNVATRTAITSIAAHGSRHQHRRSSSKTSCPPGGQRGSEPAASNAPAAPGAQEKRPGSNGSSRRRKSRYSATAEEQALKTKDDAFANVPSVPPTNHRTLDDLKISSFFAFHRPISPNSTFPPTTSAASFNQIFEPRSPPKPNDVIYTLSSAVNALDGVSSSHSSDDLHNHVLAQSASSSDTIHLDSPPSLEQMVKNFRPFQKPPPPVPFADLERAAQHRRADMDKSHQRDHHPQQQPQHRRTKPASRKTWTTTLTIDETTTAAGATTYTARATPIVQRPSPARPNPRSPLANAPQPQQQLPPARQPFLARMHARGLAQLDDLQTRMADAQERTDAAHADAVEEGQRSIGDGRSVPEERHVEDENETGTEREMLLISVKRQRKLKMKKHKYKKLMRRTRNLRRRQGRV